MSDPRRRLLLALALLALASPLAAQKGKKVDPLDALVERWFVADEHTPAGRTERAAVLAELDAAGPLAPADVAAWSAKVLARWKTGPKLEKKVGQHWFWEKEERGKYIVGGETKKPRGLFLGMHGGGAGVGEATDASSFHDPAVQKMKWLGIYPEVLEKTEHGWTDSGTEEFVIELVEEALRTWDIDRDHVYFGGHSMGGYGSWTLGAHFADMVAALAPSAGAPTPLWDSSRKPVDIIAGVIPNLRNVAMVIYQSIDDPKVPVETNRCAVEKLKEAKARWGGYDFEYWEVDGRGHDEPPGGNKAHLEKIQDKVRDPRPLEVVWQPTLPWKRQSYWLWWDEPALDAIVVAELLPSENKVRISCDKPVAGLHVLLDDKLLDLGKEVVIELNGKERYRGTPAPSRAAILLSGSRGDPRLLFTCRVPVVVKPAGK